MLIDYVIEILELFKFFFPGISAAYAEIQAALLELSTISTNSKDVNENSL